jgi:hypothetical protein
MANENSNKSHFKLEYVGIKSRGRQAWVLWIRDETTLVWKEVPYDLYMKDLFDLATICMRESG